MKPPGRWMRPETWPSALHFFFKYLPYILRTITETGMYDVLDQPETIRLLSDISRLSKAIEGIGLTAKELPDQFGEERKKLMDDLLKAEKKFRGLSADIRKSLATGNEMAVSSNEAAASINRAAISIDKLVKRIHDRGKPGKFDIMEWFETFHEVSEAAKQAQVLVAMVDKLLADHGLEQEMSHLKQGFDALLLRAFILAALLIVFFFLALLGYRYLSQQFLRRRK
jgi:hypothetical protein